MSDESKLNDELTKMLFESNELLRSSYSIALREGQETNWPAYKTKLYELLKRQQQYLYGQKGGTTTLAPDAPPCPLDHRQAAQTGFDVCPECHEVTAERR